MESEKGPRVLADDLRNAIVEEVNRGWDYPSKASLICHIAFLVPQGQAFSQADVIAISLSVATNTVGTSWAIEQCCTNGELIHVSGGEHPSYALERTRRAKYRKEKTYAPLQLANPEPEKQAVSEQLENLRAKISEPEEAVFFDETLLCLRGKAYRAAIVMGWNLAFAHVRRWVFRRHLAQFSKELTTRDRSKTKRYEPVADERSFPDSEYFVLEVARDAGLIKKHEFDILKSALTLRNLAAHPSPYRSDPASASGYVSHLLNNILLSGEFD